MNGTKDWVWRIGYAMVAALVAYFTAQGATQAQIARLDAREDAHFGQVMRRVDELRETAADLRRDISEMRRDLLDAFRRERPRP